MAELYFSREEYAERLRKVKAGMSAEGIDALILTEPQNMYYLTGYDAYSFYVVQAVIVALDADLPLWTGRFMDATSTRRTTYLPEAAILPYPDAYVQATDRHPMEFIARIIEEKGWGKKTLGVEMGLSTTRRARTPSCRRRCRTPASRMRSSSSIGSASSRATTRSR